MATQAQRLFTLYQGLDRAHGTYSIGRLNKAKNKVDGRASTVLESPTEEKWQKHIDGEQGIGIVPIRDDGTCYWGAIDIDKYPLDLEELDRKLHELKLPLTVLRTKSGGAHVTLYCSEPVSAKLLRSRLMEFAVVLGYPGVEVFPKQVNLASETDVGNWLNMPYFDQAKTARYAVDLGRPLGLDHFLDLAESRRITAKQLAEITIEPSESGEAFSDGPPCLQTMATHGFPEGTRNNALFAIGVYLRKKFGDQWEDKLDDYNHRFVDPPLKSREVLTVAKSVARKDYFYPCSKAPCIGACNKEVCRNREFGLQDGPDELNVQIGTLTKVMTNPPTWIIEVDGHRIQLETEDLMSQARFAKLCVERLNIWPAMVKPKTWKRVIDDKLSNVDQQEAPEDASPDGRFIYHLEQFCTNVAQARTQDEILLGKPYTENGHTYFRSNDLMRYLDQQHFREMSAKRVWAVMRESGAQHKQWNIKGKCVQVWYVKAFPEQTSGFDVPSHGGDAPL